MKRFKKIYVVVALVLTILCLLMGIDSVVGWYMGLPKGLYFSTKGVENFPIGSHFMLLMYLWFIYSWIDELKKLRRNK